MNPTASAPRRAHAVRAATLTDTPVPAPMAVQWTSAWLDVAVAWQAASWAANLEAMRLTQQALLPATWTHVAEQWAYLLRNGPIPG